MATYRHPYRIESAHERRILVFVREFAGLVDRLVTKRLPRIYPQPEQDAAPRLDDLTYLHEVIGELRLRWSTEIATDERIAETCAQTGEQLDMFAMAEARRRIAAEAARAAVVVPLFRLRPNLAQMLPEWVAEHATLISRGGTWRGRVVTPLGDKAISQIEDVVTEGFRTGRRHEQVAKDINERVGVMRSRARLIARDQTNKANGRLMRAKFEDVGLTHYIWKTSRDERVRDTHAANEGKVVSWTNPPPLTGNVGDDINCRCTSAPYFPT